LTDKIFDHIRDKILSGEWQSGIKIPSEVELAEDLGVSRMSLRMAIQKSNVLGLTETLVGEGTYVRDFNMRSYFSELYDSKILAKNYNVINDFRMILQIGSIRLAFEKPNIVEDAGELEKIYLEMEIAAGNDDLERFNELDSQFHQSICALSDNELMCMLYDAIEHTLNEVSAKNVENSIKTAGSYKYILHFHKSILEGIKERDIQKCIDTEMESRARSYKYYEKM
jgi:GntR family transcriptional repressor for pyruvate dehydrogenase complex